MEREISRPQPPDPESASLAREFDSLSENLLAEYAGVCEKLKGMEALKDGLKSLILHYSRGQIGAVPVGRYSLILKRRKGNTQVLWQKWCEDQVGADAVKELLQTRDGVRDGQISSVYVEQGRDIVTVEVMRNETTDDRSQSRRS